MKQELVYERFKNCHKGETCVIVCNGPSLRDVDDDFLAKYPTFATNLIVMHETFVPTYFVGLGVDHFDIPERQQAVWDMLDDPRLKNVFINRLWIQDFNHWKVHSVLSGTLYGYPNYEAQEDNNATLAFSLDPLKFLSAFATTTYAEIQIAAYMGFKRILFVGLDHSYDVSDPMGQHFYEQGTESAYSPPAYPWETNEEYQLKAELAYRVAQQVCDSLGVALINITPDSALEVFKKESIEKWR